MRVCAHLTSHEHQWLINSHQLSSFDHKSWQKSLANSRFSRPGQTRQHLVCSHLQHCLHDVAPSCRAILSRRIVAPSCRAILSRRLVAPYCRAICSCACVLRWEHVGKLGNIATATKMFLNVFWNICISQAANYASKTMFSSFPRA